MSRKAGDQAKQKLSKSDIGWVCVLAIIAGIVIWFIIVLHNQQVVYTSQAKDAAIRLRQLDRDKWPELLEKLEWPYRAVSFAGDGYVYPESSTYKFKTMNGERQLPVIWVFQYGTKERKWIINRYNLAPSESQK